ncbi:SDR family oxidoreductase [Pontibacter sp. MBLB2868]|uniref:SDR family oxidoreductase n=1 Tax=Pontibacter sp. MBLB2868 TaxID=3451555 RepID=UPI003F74F7C4
MHTTILVTGATGNVGREVVTQLAVIDGDLRVRAGVHSLIKGENLKRLPDVEIVEIDFKNRESLHAAFTHVDKLFLITPFAEDQIEMAKILVDEAKKTGVKHIVKLSAMGADAEPGIQLGRWHREIEKYIEESGIAYTFLRPALFMQNLENFNSESIKKEGKFYMSTGDGEIGYIDTRDIAAAAVEVLTSEGHEGKSYDLTGPEALSNYDVAQIMTEVLGRKVSYVDVPEENAREAMKQQGMPEKLADALLELHGVYRSGYSNEVNDEVQSLIGRKPHSFRQFMMDYKDCFM